MIVRFVLLLLIYADVSASSFCSDGIIFDTDCYLFEKRVMDFVDAEATCSKNGGHLVSIHDDNFNQFISKSARQKFNDSSVAEVWIGLNGSMTSEIWEWTDGTKYNYTNWIVDDPKNEIENKCAVLSVFHEKWSTDDCFYMRSYICKIAKDDYIETSTSSLPDPYIPCQSWISFGIDDSNNLDADSFNNQLKFVTTIVGEISHPERIQIDGVHDEIVQWNNELSIQEIQTKIKSASQTGMYSLSNQLAYLVIHKQQIQTSDKIFAALIFVSDTSDPALQATNAYIKDLADIQLTFILLGNDSDPIKLMNFTTNFIYWRDLTQSQPENWESLSYSAYGCKESPSTTETTSIVSSSKLRVTNSSFSTTKMPTSSTTLATTKTLTSTSPEDQGNKSSAWWYVSGSLAVTILAGVIIFCFCRRRRQVLQKRRQNIEERSRINFEEKIEASPLEARLSTEERQRNYINKKWIQYDSNKIVGKGASAVVYKGNFEIDKNNKSKNKLKKYEEIYTVALKIPINFVTNDDIEEFVRELDALIKIGSHPNIIKFYGWTLELQIPVLITELAQMNLLEFVRNFRGHELPIKNILSILWQITLALEHIASLSMVHRDVACRNILLTKSGVAKLTDFGLCCQCDESFTYRASLHKRLPLKWCSIEALVDRIFSEKSDVWSFGVLCYEAFSYGAVPFPALSNVEMLEALQSGKRLKKPEKASDEMYKLMLRCWQEKPIERPNFKELSECLRIFLENETCDYGYLTLGVIPDNRRIKIMDEI